MFGPRHQWKWRIPCLILSLSVGLYFTYQVTFSDSRVKEPERVYLMPGKSDGEPVKVNSGELYNSPTSLVAKTESESTEVSTDSGIKSDYANSERRTANKKKIAELESNLAEIRRQIEIEKEKIRINHEWQELADWVRVNYLPKHEELVVDLDFISDPDFTGDNFDEYFAEPEDRIHYGKKFLEYLELADTLASKLATVDPAIRDEVLSRTDWTGGEHLSNLVKEKMGGDL